MPRCAVSIASATAKPCAHRWSRKPRVASQSMRSPLSLEALSLEALSLETLSLEALSLEALSSKTLSSEALATEATWAAA